MKIRADKDTLAGALALAARFSGSAASMPALSGLHLHAADGTLTVRASSVDASAVVAASDVDVLDDGEAVIPGRRLVDAVKAMRADTAELTVEDGFARLAGGKGSGRLPTLPADDFPVDLGDQLAEPVTLATDHGALADAVKAAERVVAKDPSRPALGGIQLEWAQQTLDVVATDGYRLTHRQLPVAVAAGDGEPVTAALVPAGPLRHALDAVGAGENPQVVVGSGLLSVATDRVRVTIRLTEAQFPAWRDFVAIEEAGAATVDIAELRSAVAAVTAFDDGGEGALELAAAEDGDAVTLSLVGSGDGGAGDEMLDATFDGALPTVSLRAAYLLTALEQFGDADTARIAVVDAQRPLKVTAPDASAAGQHIVMPYLIRR